MSQQGDALPPLSRATLGRLASARRPLVDLAGARPRIVHFGLGAFHRAHQAVYTEVAAARAGQPWSIADVAPRSAEVVAAMRRQDCLYSVTDRAPDAASTRVVGSVAEALLMRRDAARVNALLADPEVTVVTLTITEKGYHRRRDTGGLDLGAAEVAADLGAARAADPTVADPPDLRTVVGRLAAALVGRYRATAAPITVVSCDNMTGNGAALRCVVHDFVAAVDWPDAQRVLEWLASAVGFPATVLDRIVPATTAGDRDTASAALGLRDELAVSGEPYPQWVLQDAFSADRPPWELDGALLVPDATPYQLMKLRLLNGSHSAMAYLGAVVGCRTVADVLRTEWGERFVRRFAEEVAPTLPDAGLDVPGYVDDLVERYRNPEINHQLRQIGSDGSHKIPERWFDPVRALRAAGAGTPMLELSLAGWVNASRPDDGGTTVLEVVDPAAEALAECWRAGGSAPELVARLLRVIGGADLAERADLTASVAARLPALRAGRVEL